MLTRPPQTAAVLPRVISKFSTHDCRVAILENSTRPSCNQDMSSRYQRHNVSGFAHLQAPEVFSLANHDSRLSPRVPCSVRCSTGLEYQPMVDRRCNRLKLGNTHSNRWLAGWCITVSSKVQASLPPTKPFVGVWPVRCPFYAVRNSSLGLAVMSSAKVGQVPMSTEPSWAETNLTVITSPNVTCSQGTLPARFNRLS